MIDEDAEINPPLIDLESSIDENIEQELTADSSVLDFTDDNLDINVSATDIETRIHDGLSKSAYLSPVYVSVINMSYWYLMRKKLTPKKQNSVILKFNQSSSKWDVSYFRMKPNDEGKLTPQRQLLGSFKSKLAAYKKCDRICRERDSHPLIPGTEQDVATHLRLLVVSDKFYRLSHTERVVLIYDQLVSSIGTSVSENSISLGQCAPRKMKLASLYGKNVCQLPPFSFILPNQPLTLFIEALTPSQWKPDNFQPPDSERYGRSHVTLRSMELPTAVLPKAQKDRIKSISKSFSDSESTLKLPPIGTKNSLGEPLPPTLRSASESVGNLTHTYSKISHLSVADTLGVESRLSGVEYKRQGGIYGHFFRDLPAGVKAMVMERWKSNQLKIQRESNAASIMAIEEEKLKAKAARKGNNFTPVTNLSTLRKKSALDGKLAPYDQGTTSESEMLEDLVVSTCVLEKWVIRIQRIRRQNITIRAAKVCFRRKLSVLLIQKVLRGHFGRLYVSILRRLIPRAARRIYRSYRNYRTRLVLMNWRYLTKRFTRILLPLAKSWIVSVIHQWITRRNFYATRIQSMIRMQLCKCRYLRMLGTKYFLGDYIHRQAIEIQRIFRAMLGRRRHHRLYNEVLIERVDRLASIRIQRIYRGVLGRRKARQRKRMLQAVAILQRNIRRFVRHVWEAEMRRIRLINAAATMIQRRVRGMIDREIVEKLRRKHFYVNVYIPCVIRIQSWARSLSCQRMYQHLRIQHQAAFCIQHFRFRYLKRQEAMRKWKEARLAHRQKMAVVIQKWIRRMIARIRFEKIVLSYEGVKILAAKKIFRAWVNFKNAKRLQILLDDHRLSIYQKKIDKLRTARLSVEKDIIEVKIDREFVEKAINRMKDRLHTLEIFQREASGRVLIIQKEMSEMTPDDFERGWAEAFGHEYESLTYQLAMSREEIRLLKYHINQRLQESLGYELEWEEAELEMHNISIMELEAYEGLRRSEVIRIERRVEDKWKRRIRQEVSRWKTDAVRHKVIQKSRPAYHSLVEKSRKGGRDVGYAQTVRYEKRAQIWDKEQILLERFLEEDGRLASQNTHFYEDYSKPVQETYDSVISNTLQLLHGYSLDQRAKALQDDVTEKNRIEKRKAFKRKKYLSEG